MQDDQNHGVIIATADLDADQQAVADLVATYHGALAALIEQVIDNQLAARLFQYLSSGAARIVPRYADGTEMLPKPKKKRTPSKRLTHATQAQT